jgi:hypothetical protein
MSLVDEFCYGSGRDNGSLNAGCASADWLKGKVDVRSIISNFLNRAKSGEIMRFNHVEDRRASRIRPTSVAALDVKKTNLVLLNVQDNEGELT